MQLNKFSLSNNYMSSLRTTTCDALIVPSGNGPDTNLGRTDGLTDGRTV